MYFTPDSSQKIVNHCFAHLQDESYLAFLDTMFVLARPHRVRQRMLVLGAERDAMFTVDEVHRTARAYGEKAEVFAGMGHDMMLDENWPAVADRIDAWIRDQELQSA
jgi:pimeloyl-ACP methyl ester carboxylesterase